MAEPEEAAETEPEPEAVTETDVVAEAEPIAEPDAAAEAGADAAPEISSEPEADTEADAVTEPGEVAESEATAVPDEVEPADAVAVPAAALTILASGSVENFRERMLAAAEHFESSPTVAVAQAELVVAEAVVALHHVLLDGAVNLGAWRRSEATEPTELAEVMRSYREYLDQVLAL